MKRLDTARLPKKMRCIQQRGEWKLLEGETALVVMYRGCVYWSQQKRRHFSSVLR